MEAELVNKLVEAMELGKGETVLLNLWGTEEQMEDLYDFAGAVAGQGAMPIIMIHSGRYYEKLFNNMSEGVPEKWFKQFEAADSVIDIMESAPGIMPKGLPREKAPLYGRYLQQLFSSFSSKKKMIQITMPTEANAAMAGMDFETFKKRTLEALDIDYKKLKESCREKIRSFSGDIRKIHTGEDCVLTIDTTGREWIADAGGGSLPCGEVYIAPVEENSRGKVFFEKLLLEDKGIFKNVTMTVENGRIIAATSDEVSEFLKGLPEGGNVVAELGIGMNPNVHAIMGESSIDENAIGTFHIGIGMNHIFGGKNKCPFHMDFVGTGMVE